MSSTKRVIVAVTNDLVTDQRVHRTCLALNQSGWQVTLVGRRFKGNQPVERSYTTRRMRLLFKRSALFYAEYNLRLFFKLLFARADLFYANDTDTLLASYWAARLRRKALFFDAHELFPEVPELVDRPRVKAFWTRIEDRILPRLPRLPKGAACATVCQSIADIYHQRYGLDMAVVRNVPLSNVAVPNVQPRRTDGERILLYQGAVNKGRGVDTMIFAMEYLPNCRMLVAGVGDEYQQMKALAASKPWASRIEFLGRLEPDVLHRLTPTADLGLSLLENLGLNYYYSLPNRIADFAQCGVPVLATDFPEIRKVVTLFRLGTLVPADATPKQVAQAVQKCLAEWDALTPQERAERRQIAQTNLTWDHDRTVLLSAVDSLFSEK